MFKLTLLRHAKSDWLTNEPDIDRPLNERGRKNATCMGRHFQHIDLLPDAIIASPALRARQTADLFTAGAGTDDSPITNFPIMVEESLYLASPTTLIKTIERYATAGQHLLLVAHNPGMEELVSHLATEPPALSHNGKLMPTCTAAHFHLNSLDQLRLTSVTELNRLIRVKDIGC